MGKKLFRFLLFASLLTWCFGFSYTVLSQDPNAVKVFKPFVSTFYDNVCHQDAAKTISLSEYSFLVCSRCTGIYFGALIIAFIAVFILKEIRIPSKIFKLIILILLSDVVINNFILEGYNKVTAFITGFLFGSFILLILISLIEKSFFSKTLKV